MRINEKVKKTEKSSFFNVRSKYFLGVHPSYDKDKKKNVKELFWCMFNLFLVHQILLKECNLFSQNTQGFLEQ